MNKKLLLLATFVLMAALFMPAPAYAATDCTFTTSGKTMRLVADCMTDSTIFIPNGFTLDGRGHTITGVDPAGDHFRGAVVQNGGAVAHVKNLTVTVAGLSDVCDDGVDRLRGILFEGASGSIKTSTVLNINQGPSGCQEGNGIEVRNAPFDGTHPATKSVKVENNVVSAYQKTGILALGDVSVNIEDNTVTGLGPVNYIAQNGIQLGSGAQGRIDNNTVSGNQYQPQTFASSGILLFLGANNVKVIGNDVDASDVGIWVIATNSALVTQNQVTGAVWDGIALDDQAGNVQNNRVEKNKLSNNATGIGLYGSGVTQSLIKNNQADSNDYGLFVGFGAMFNTLQDNKANNNTEEGITIDADSNTILKNRAFGNGVLDINNVCGANTYSQNQCATSSGPPVDCPEADNLSLFSAQVAKAAAARPAPTPQD
jgi:parallel beta-helix repeat protein